MDPNDDKLLFDLDGDNRLDTVFTEPYHKWNSSICSVNFANGISLNWIAIAVVRVGVLPTKTNGVHDLVVNLDHVLVWNGKEYVPRE